MVRVVFFFSENSNDWKSWKFFRLQFPYEISNKKLIPRKSNAKLLIMNEMSDNYDNCVESMEK
jgi:hypothetical protein